MHSHYFRSYAHAQKLACTTLGAPLYYGHRIGIFFWTSFACMRTNVDACCTPQIFSCNCGGEGCAGGLLREKQGLGGRGPSDGYMHKKKPEFAICAKVAGRGRALQRVSFCLQIQMKIDCLQDFLIFTQNHVSCKIF